MLTARVQLSLNRIVKVKSMKHLVFLLMGILQLSDWSCICPPPCTCATSVSPFEVQGNFLRKQIEKQLEK